MDNPLNTINKVAKSLLDVCLLTKIAIMIVIVEAMFSVSIVIALHHLPHHAVIRIYWPTHQASSHPNTSIRSDSKPLESCETPQALVADPISPIKAVNGEQRGNNDLVYPIIP